MRKFKLAMLAVSLVILAAVIVYSNPIALAGLLAKSNLNYILAGFAISLVAILLGVLKWKVLLKGISFRELVPVQILGFTISNFTPGKAAEPAKALLLKAVKDISVSSSLASIIWERIMDVIVLILFSVAAISTLSLGSNFILAAFGVAVFIVIIAVSIGVLFSERFGRKIFSFVKKLPVLKRLPDNFMDLFYKTRISRPRLVQSFIISLVTWFILGFVLYFSLLAFGVQVSPLILSGIVALSVVIGIASSLPGGLGTTEVVMIFLLGLVGVDATMAAAAALTFRLMTIWFVNVMGGFSFIYLSRKFEIRNII
ncbi:MAG: flippase-like domain-containing protein [Candidatus Aenigmarchaeota archaeon]|nr:flippase-like domain-containing protein [Candidatus Aenigmarchaeota archaeon]